MSMREWAKREVEIACKKENPDRKEGEWDYGCACYESALKAFNSLTEDGHSGLSIGFTKHILNRLIDGKPLTPIEDTDDIWEECKYWLRTDGKVQHYQCKRMSSLFKDVYEDGSVKYSDVGRVRGVNASDPNVLWSNGMVTSIVEELFPITMPYMPADGLYKVFCEDVLSDPENGDFDTMAIHYILTPDGQRIDVNRYFKEGGTLYGCWDEIDANEYAERKHMELQRKEDKTKIQKCLGKSEEE